MNRSVESVLRFVNLASAGLLAGSLGFSDVPLVPGREAERAHLPVAPEGEEVSVYFNAIGPVALASSLILAVGSRNQTSLRRTCDILSTVGLAGVLAATVLVTVPINREIERNPPADYPSDQSQSLSRNWSRAQSVRTALGVGAFLCAAAANSSSRAR